jgi:hypothetical protein
MARTAATKPMIPPDTLMLREAAAPVGSAASSEVDEDPDSKEQCQRRVLHYETARTYQRHWRQLTMRCSQSYSQSCPTMPSAKRN